MAFVLAHLSDPHLGPLPRPRFNELLNKRTIGFLNWYRSRRGGHRAEVLQTLIRDLDTMKPDHIAVAGDLVNIALASEFAPARTFLERLGPPERVSVVPGNHDAYVRAATEHSEHHWGDYMRADALGRAPSPEAPARFPYLRRRGPMALIGVSTATPSGFFMATGKIGDEQLVRLRATLDMLSRESVFRVIMIHHPPTSGGRHLKRLTDARAFRAVLADQGADLVLHGHTHRRSIVWLEGPDKRIPAVGVPSISASEMEERGRAGYNLYRIEADPQGWRCEMISRGLLANGEVGEVGRLVLTPSTPS